MKTLIVTLLLGLADASAVFADNAVPTGISWERQAESVIWERTVEKGGMAVNAFCGAGAILRAGELRREARAALERELASETGADRTRFLALVLERAAERAVTTESADDGNLIACGRFSRGMSHHPFPGLSSAGDGGGRFYACLPVCAPASSGPSYHAKKRTAIKFFDDTARFRTGVNLIGYSFDTVKFDAYRLYLYQWNDIPLTRNNNIIPPACLNPSPWCNFKFQHPSDPLCPPGISPFARGKEKACPLSPPIEGGVCGSVYRAHEINAQAVGIIPGISIHFQQLINAAHHHAHQGAPA